MRNEDNPYRVFSIKLYTVLRNLLAAFFQHGFSTPFHMVWHVLFQVLKQGTHSHNDDSKNNTSICKCYICSDKLKSFYDFMI